MFAIRDKKQYAGGFTLVEMLVTIGVIAVLVAMIVPALSMVRETADRVSQKAQFSTLEISLEAYKNDFGDYPPDAVPVDLIGSYQTYYSGAHRLTEALIGQDGFGVDIRTQFTWPWPDGGNAYDRDSGTFDLGKRKGPYLEPEKASPVKLGQIYGDGDIVPSPDAYVIGDKFAKVRKKGSDGRTGMPVLYYKAKVSNSAHDPAAQTDDPLADTINIYNPIANVRILEQTPPSEITYSTSQQFGSDLYDEFYTMTRNMDFGDVAEPSTWRPYRSQSFILQSAGADGLYFTNDDIFNFDRE